MLDQLLGNCMRKTNLNLKRLNFAKHFITYFVVVQSLILLLFFGLFYASKPIDVNSAKTAQIIVEDKEHKRVFREYRCVIFSNGLRYDFPNEGILGKYTPKELYDTISKGEKLDITYVKAYTITGSYNLIINAQSEKSLYLDFNLYNVSRSKAHNAVCLSFAVLEFLFLIGSAFVIAFKRKDLKLF